MLKKYFKLVVKGCFSDSIREIVGLLLIILLVRTFGFGLYQVPTGSMETTMLVGERFFADKFTVLFSSPKHGDIISFSDPSFEYSENPFVRWWQSNVGVLSFDFSSWWPLGLNPSNWTKRVIGIPGDIIKGVIENGKPVVYRNGQKLEEPYLNKYPLIGVWTVDPLKLFELQRKGFDTARLHLIDMRSYDSSYNYEDQPFYRIDPLRLVRGPNSGLLLKYPQEADYPNSQKIVRRGNSYWSSSDEFYVELGKDEYWLMGDNRRGSKDSRYLGPIKGDLIHGRILYRIWSVDSTESWWIVDLIKHPVDFWKRIRWNRFFQLVK